MMRALLVLSFFLLGCSGKDATPLKPLDVKEKIGRYQYHPPAGEMPAVLLDTATGCVEVFGKATSLDNPADVSWWRSFADHTVPDVTYENGKAKQVPDSAPPQRCQKQGRVR